METFRFNSLFSHEREQVLAGERLLVVHPDVVLLCLRHRAKLLTADAVCVSNRLLDDVSGTVRVAESDDFACETHKSVQELVQKGVAACEEANVSAHASTGHT